MLCTYLYRERSCMHGKIPSLEEYHARMVYTCMGPYTMDGTSHYLCIPDRMDIISWTMSCLTFHFPRTCCYCYMLSPHMHLLIILSVLLKAAWSKLRCSIIARYCAHLVSCVAWIGHMPYGLSTDMCRITGHAFPYAISVVGLWSPASIYIAEDIYKVYADIYEVHDGSIWVHIWSIRRQHYVCKSVVNVFGACNEYVKILCWQCR